MANIGSFKKSGSEFQGEIVTLIVKTKTVRIVPAANRSNHPNAPPGPPGGAFRSHAFTDCRLSANTAPATDSATQCRLSRLVVPVQ